MIKIHKVADDRRDYLHLLLLADEQLDMVERYLGRGDMWVLEDGGRVVGECLVTDEGDGVAEVKSLAVDPAFQGQGFGRALLDTVAAHYAGDFNVLQVGTGDGPRTVPFYEHCGFSRHHVVEGFFAQNYDHPIVEGDVPLRDMVYLRRELKRGVCNCERSGGDAKRSQR